MQNVGEASPGIRVNLPGGGQMLITHEQHGIQSELPQFRGIRPQMYIEDLL